MKLNLQIIAEKLKHYSPELHFSNSSLLLKSLKLVNKDQDSFETNYVYLGKAQDILLTTLFESQVSIICIGNIPMFNDSVYPSNFNLIRLDEKNNLEAIFNEVQDIFDFYSEWDSTLQDSIIKDKRLQNLIDLSYNIFGNPMYLMDSAYMTLASSNEIKSDALDSLWSSVVNEGHVHIDLINDLRKTKTIDYLNSIKSATFFSYEEFYYRSIVVNIFILNKKAASLTILDINDTLNESHLELANYLAHKISIALKEDVHYQNTHDTLYENFIVDQLVGNTYNKVIVQFHLNHLRWKINDKYSLLKIEIDQSDINNTNLEYTSILLGGIFPDSRTVIYKDNIIIIMNMNLCFGSWEDSLKSLEEFLIKFNLKGCLSNNFNDFSELHEQYQLLSSSVELGSMIDGNKRLFIFKDYALFHLIENYPKNMNLTMLCHPAAMKLFYYDKENRTDYLYSLYIYLVKDKSLIDSAATLHIHRNSFLYRIKKINDLINTDLNNESDKLQLLVSYKILEYVTKSQN